MMIVNAFFAGGIAAGRPPEVSLDISKDALERQKLSSVKNLHDEIKRKQVLQRKTCIDVANKGLFLALQKEHVCKAAKTNIVANKCLFLALLCL